MDYLNERVVAITGGARGIGREYALLMAREGARVVINDVEQRGDSATDDVVEQIVAAGGAAVACPGDVTDPETATAIVKAALSSFGRLDVVVNNAGILRDRVLVNMSDAEWDASIAVNLTGTFLVGRAAAQYWREQSKSGDQPVACLINTSSESGVFANAGQSNYAAAKAGVAALTEVWHKELGRYGVRVNAILPRARTRLTESDAIQPREGKFDHWDPANVAPFVTYLAGKGCDISGQVFLVGGGLVQRAAPWSLDPNWRLERKARWTIEELAEAVREAGPPTNEGRATGMIR